MAALKSLTRGVLSVPAAVLFAAGWLVGLLCGVCVWTVLAVKVGWTDGWSLGGPAR